MIKKFVQEGDIQVSYLGQNTTFRILDVFNISKPFDQQMNISKNMVLKFILQCEGVDDQICAFEYKTHSNPKGLENTLSVFQPDIRSLIGKEIEIYTGTRLEKNHLFLEFGRYSISGQSSGMDIEGQLSENEIKEFDEILLDMLN